MCSSFLRGDLIVLRIGTYPIDRLLECHMTRSVCLQNYTEKVELFLNLGRSSSLSECLEPTVSS